MSGNLLYSSRTLIQILFRSTDSISRNVALAHSENKPQTPTRGPGTILGPALVLVKDNKFPHLQSGWIKREKL